MPRFDNEVPCSEEGREITLSPPCLPLRPYFSREKFNVAIISLERFNLKGPFNSGGERELERVQPLYTLSILSFLVAVFTL